VTLQETKQIRDEMEHRLGSGLELGIILPKTTSTWAIRISHRETPEVSSIADDAEYKIALSEFEGFYMNLFFDVAKSLGIDVKEADIEFKSSPADSYAVFL
jgi:hypothetical protein